VAVQITKDTFFLPHSERVPGVLYYPASRQAIVQTRQGGQIAGLGDWIAGRPDGTLSCERADEFRGTLISADVLVFRSRSSPHE
jgi:hypothetical protein